MFCLCFGVVFVNVRFSKYHVSFAGDFARALSISTLTRDGSRSVNAFASSVPPKLHGAVYPLRCFHLCLHGVTYRKSPRVNR